MSSELVESAVDWALLNGLVMRSANTGAAPGTGKGLASIPKQCFKKAMLLQPLFNNLVHKVASDDEFLVSVMNELSLGKVDDFTEKCFEIYQYVRAEGSTQQITLGIHRSDYLLHQNESSGDIDIQQVELNTIAASFACLSTKTSELHTFLHGKGSQSKYELPPNGSLDGITKALAKAWDLYGSKTAVVVMVVQPGERNAFDQRLIENVLSDKYGIKLLRRTLLQLGEQGQLVGEERKLVLSGGYEVALAYYRAGYAPTDYPSQKEWAARLLVERSYAIKCPSAAYHLAGTKKVQQLLANSATLARFEPYAPHAKFLMSSFTGLFPLDPKTAAGQAAYEMAMREPHRFVMKPQREGGGNNIYGTDVKLALLKMKEEERAAYILMELICPPPAKGQLVRAGSLIEGPVISELGIYGAWLSEGNVVHMNEALGHLLRTKVAESHEGGVAAGYSVLDAPNLF